MVTGTTASFVEIRLDVSGCEASYNLMVYQKLV